MADSPENNKSLCQYAESLSLADVLCPKEASPAVKKQIEAPPVKPLEKTPLPQVKAPGLIDLQWGGTNSTKPELKQKPVEKAQDIKTVYLDLGHCTSQDPGKPKDQGFQSDSYTECQVNQAVGKLLIEDLKSEPYRVVTSWNPDSPPPLVSKQQDLQRRINVVNADIKANGGDSIYISLHHDNDPTGMGGQCVYFASPKEAEAGVLARTMQASAWKTRYREDVPMCIEPDTRTHNGKLIGLRGVNTIGLLIEGANVQNAEDKRLMNDPAFHRLEARKIAEGIRNYFQLKLGSQRPYPPNYYAGKKR